jgi:hypothetical protein
MSESVIIGEVSMKEKTVIGVSGKISPHIRNGKRSKCDGGKIK